MTRRPEVRHRVIDPGIVLSNGGTMVKRFPVERKKWRLNQDVVKNLSEEVGSDVPELIVSDRGKTTTLTIKSMFDGETMPADTVGR